MSKSKVFVWFCLCFIIGIALDSFLKITQPLWLGFLIFGFGALLIVCLFGLNPRAALNLRAALGFIFCLIILIGGIFWHQRALNIKQADEINKYCEQEIAFQGVVIREPERRINGTKLSIKAEKIKIDGQWRDISGRVLASIELYPQYNYGDRLEISGKLKEPAIFEDFDYREYLTKDKIYSVVYYPQIELISKNQANWFFRIIFSFKDKLRGIIDKTLLPPKSSILKAVFLGDKYGLPDNLKEKLNLTGTRHIVAISGMHMIIMMEILLYLFLALGFWRKQAFYFTIFFLTAYIILIGAPSSAVRAGIMAGLLLLAQNLGRLRSTNRAIVFAAFLMLLVNPLLLKVDVGFQLSFIAVLSIVYLKPILDKKLDKLPNPFQLRDILTLTLSAQIGVLPILIFHFGQLSLISPLANLLIVPFLPFLMIGGLIISFIGLAYLPIAKLLAFPVWLLLGYFIKVIDVLSSIPLAAFELKNVSWIILIGYYLILIYFFLKKEKGQNFILTPYN